MNSTQDIAWNIEAEGPLPPIADTQTLSWPIDQELDVIGAFQALSWVVGATDETIEVVLDNAPTGLVGDLTVSITTIDGTTTIYFPTNEGIEEEPEGSGRYVATVTRPTLGRYRLTWSDGSTSIPLILTVLQDDITLTINAPTTADIGDQALIEATFTDSASQVITPDQVQAQVTTPAGTTTTYTAGTSSELTQDTNGTYLLQVDIDQPGHWYYTINSTGDIIEAAEPGSIYATTATPTSTWAPAYTPTP